MPTSATKISTHERLQPDVVCPIRNCSRELRSAAPFARIALFFFTNFEQRQLNQTNSISITAANATAINQVLSADKYPGQPLNISPTGITIYPNPVRSSNFFAKMDHHINQRDDLSIRYSLYHVSSVNSRGAGGLSYTSASAGLDNLDQTIAVSNVFTLTSMTVNETRGQFTKQQPQSAGYRSHWPAR